MTDIPAGWELRGKPPTLFRRFEFPRYAATRDFLDALAALSETQMLHPQNINFGSAYVNITLEVAAADGAAEYDFAARINTLYAATPPASESSA